MAVFSRTFALPAGPRVRLRLAVSADAGHVARLLAKRGVVATELDVRRLVTYDPTRRRVACAFAPLDGRETLVGVAAIDLEHGAAVDTLVVDERLTDGLGELMVSVLSERAARSRRVA